MHTPVILLLLILVVHFTKGADTFDMWKIIERESKVDPSVQHDPSVFIKEGDIYTSVAEEEEKIKFVQSAPTAQQMVLFTWHLRLWPRNIPFKFDNSYSTEDIKKVLQSFKLISEVSCLRFRNYRSTDSHWLEFFKGKGCHSGIGRAYYRDRKPTRISLGKHCVHTSIIVHEILHALGFFHEQSRVDRDSFVTIHRNHIIKGNEYNFDKNIYAEEFYGDTQYDYRSIMHYGRTTFINDINKGSTIENKFDPLMELGGTTMSKIDITEINARYQCNVKTGWSNWTPWTRCIADWRGTCTKGSVRFCVSENYALCSGANKYGVENKVIKCQKSECEATKKFKDGFWGSWGPYDKCSGKCGWGVQTRKRICNNPVPQYGGKECMGLSQMMHLCRNTRCGKASQNDMNFENGFNQWQSNGFVRQRGRANSPGGPYNDHTSQIQSVQGWYGMAKHRRPKVATLKSPLIVSFTGEKCLMFYYQLNGGRHLHEKSALVVNVEYKNGPIVNFPFRIGGHHGNYWRRAAVNLKGLSRQFRIVFQAEFSWTESIVAIDDIFFDHNKCDQGLEDCKDIDPKCSQYATKTFCKKHFRQALQKCCYTCSDSHHQKTTKKPPVTPPKLTTANTCIKDTTKYSKDCSSWVKKGYCEASSKYAPFMNTHCCKSCSKSVSVTTAVSTKMPRPTITSTITTTQVTTKKKCIEEPYYKDKCPIWVQRGLCTSRIKFWKDLMSVYCCKECDNNQPSKCVEIKEYKHKCPIWARRGYCTTSVKFWKDLMSQYCCDDCKKLG